VSTHTCDLSPLTEDVKHQHTEQLGVHVVTFPVLLFPCTSLIQVKKPFLTCTFLAERLCHVSLCHRTHLYTECSRPFSRMISECTIVCTLCSNPLRSAEGGQVLLTSSDQRSPVPEITQQPAGEFLKLTTSVTNFEGLGSI